MKTKEKIVLSTLVCLYLLMTISFIPGSLSGTINATIKHLMVTLPYSIGMTILAVSIIQKVVGEKLLLDRVARIYLMIGLFSEIIYAIYDYTTKGQMFVG